MPLGPLAGLRGNWRSGLLGTRVPLRFSLWPSGGIIMSLGSARLRDGRSGLLDKAGRCARSFITMRRLSSSADAAMRSVLIRLCLALVYVLVLLEVGMVLGAVT